MENSDTTKPVVVRMKRKRMLAPIETLWLEVDERPLKRGGLQGLTLADDEPGGSVATKSRFLFSRVQTVISAEALLESLEELKKERTKTQKKQREPIIRPLNLGASAKTLHDVVARQTRFEQVWSSRRGVSNAEDDNAVSMELFRLFDVVRVDIDDEEAGKAARRDEDEEEAVEKDQRQCNYLPFPREYRPSVAAEAKAPTETEGTVEQEEVDAAEFVYDVYTLDEDSDEDHAEAPTVLIACESFDWRELTRDPDYDSEDSNASGNPDNDYPDEEELSLQSDSESDFEHRDPFEVSDEEYDTVAYDAEEEEMYWRSRMYQMYGDPVPEAGNRQEASIELCREDKEEFL